MFLGRKRRTRSARFYASRGARKPPSPHIFTLFKILALVENGNTHGAISHAASDVKHKHGRRESTSDGFWKAILRGLGSARLGSVGQGWVTNVSVSQ